MLLLTRNCVVEINQQKSFLQLLIQKGQLQAFYQKNYLFMMGVRNLFFGLGRHKEDAPKCRSRMIF